MARLTDESVGTAALGILDTEGTRALSFRRIGDVLGTSHMTVHRYCGNFEGLLDICAEQVAAKLPDIDPALPWRRSTELRFTALYESLASHWGLVALQRGQPWLGPEMMRRFAEPSVAASLAAGLTPQQVSACHRELYVFTVGCALTQTTFGGRSASAAMASLAPDRVPVMARHRDTLVDDRSDHDVFLNGLRTLIASWDPTGAVGTSTAHHDERRRPAPKKNGGRT